MDKIRILYAMGGTMKRAGAETMIMQYLRQLRKDRTFEFSILVHGDGKGDYDDEIASYGIPIYHAPIRGKHPLSYGRAVADILRSHPVDIVHCNMDNASGYFLEIAKKCRIPVRIAHSHTTRLLAQGFIRKFIGELSKRKIHTVATKRLACSKKAGDWLFGHDPYMIVNNAIDMHPYALDEKIRKELRMELNINKNAFVMIHIGSFTYPKNHEQLLQIFRNLKKVRPDSRLLLAGVGPLMNHIQDMAHQMNIEDDVVFLGLRADIPQLLQVADVFVMPSLMEGLPVSGIEAQAAGLPCLFADTITPEVCMTKYAKRLPLSNEDAWIEQLMKIHGERNWKEAQDALREHGYDIQLEAEKLADVYKKIAFD